MALEREQSFSAYQKPGVHSDKLIQNVIKSGISQKIQGFSRFLLISRETKVRKKCKRVQAVQTFFLTLNDQISSSKPPPLKDRRNETPHPPAVTFIA